MSALWTFPPQRSSAVSPAGLLTLVIKDGGIVYMGEALRTRNATNVRATGVAYVRFAAPDLAELDRFMVEFGFGVATKVGHRHYYSGADGTPFLYVASEGEPAFEGFGFHLQDLEDLEALAARSSASVEELDGPAAGWRVQMTDPDGFQVEAVVSETIKAPAELRPSLPANVVGESRRKAQERRLSLTGAQVCRLGHVVLQVRDLRRSEAWYKDHFGLLTSDEIINATGDGSMAMFLRLDRGEMLTDHHSLFLLQADQPGFHHAAFEVRDLDDLMVGHDRLKAAGRQHHRGVGRHLLGGQVFDYWRDPWGRVLEHWTDGDIFNAFWGPRVSTVEELYADVWRTSLKS